MASEDAYEDEREDTYLLDSPEMPPIAGSEIEGVIDTSAVGADGIPRPVFVNQFDEEVLALTYDDVTRLHDFLSIAVKYLKEYKNRITQ